MVVKMMKRVKQGDEVMVNDVVHVVTCCVDAAWMYDEDVSGYIVSLKEKRL